MGDHNPRFKSENILALELDMPERTTYDYGTPGFDDRVQVCESKKRAGASCSA
jgi:kinesin family protein 3/17